MKKIIWGLSPVWHWARQYIVVTQLAVSLGQLRSLSILQGETMEWNNNTSNQQQRQEKGIYYEYWLNNQINWGQHQRWGNFHFFGNCCCSMHFIYSFLPEKKIYWLLVSVFSGPQIARITAVAVKDATNPSLRYTECQIQAFLPASQVWMCVSARQELESSYSSCNGSGRDEKLILSLNSRWQLREEQRSNTASVMILVLRYLFFYHLTAFKERCLG